MHLLLVMIDGAADLEYKWGTLNCANNGTKLPGFSSAPGKNVRPSAIQNCPRNIEHVVF